LFLEEIGEVPLAMQAKPLRVLQEQELERTGDTRTRKVNVRVIAATNRDLTKEVDEGRFREDLFYRLSVFPIDMPLRECCEDVAPLAAHFIRQSTRRMNRPEPAPTQAPLSQLASYDWPGNVRELPNVIERSIILRREGPLTFDVPAARQTQNPAEHIEPAAKRAPLLRVELKRQEARRYCDCSKANEWQALWTRRRAAELLGMKPTTLASRISAMGLNRKKVPSFPVNPSDAR
jgi:transcriptional regulator with GAF, ATPase, and Fis domain